MEKPKNPGPSTPQSSDGKADVGGGKPAQSAAPGSPELNAAGLTERRKKKITLESRDVGRKNCVSMYSRVPTNMDDRSQKTTQLATELATEQRRTQIALKDTQNALKKTLLDRDKSDGSAHKTPFDYGAFLDRHFARIGPGVHRIKYTHNELMRVIRDATNVFAGETTLLEVDPPVIIVGDIHGQFNDLLNIFLLLGRPPEKRYLFLGDYVDRGGMSLECIVMMFAYKVFYPQHVFLLRGNHECARVNKKYGFMDDCEAAVPPPHQKKVWALFQRAFNNMPICAVIGHRILCMHGGLSPSLEDFDTVKKMPKPIRNPFRGVINDLLWADPDMNVCDWRNSPRGSGFAFGQKVIEEVCRRLDIDLVVRAHQMCLDGFWTFADKKLITLFSAPLYCNLYHNAGAVLDVSPTLECQLITFLPESRGCEDRVRKNNALWDDTVDKI